MYPQNYMSMGGRSMHMPSYPGMGTPYDQTEQGYDDYVRGLGDQSRSRDNQRRGGGQLGGIVQQMMGGGSERPGGFSGVGGQPGKQGPGQRGYYRFGAIPTGFNSEVIKPQYYDYSGTPDMAKMIQNPWDPTQWDPDRDFTPGGRTPTEARQRRMGGRRHTQSRFRR